MKHLVSNPIANQHDSLASPSSPTSPLSEDEGKFYLACVVVSLDIGFGLVFLFDVCVNLDFFVL